MTTAASPSESHPLVRSNPRAPVPHRTLLLGIVAGLLACSTAGVPAPAPQVGHGEAVPTTPPSTAPPGPVWTAELDAEGQRWVDETLAGMSTDELIGQIVIPWIPGGYEAEDSQEFLELVDWVERLGLGGVSISIGWVGMSRVTS